MYLDPELRDRVYQVFSLEVFQMLQTIETDLIALGLDRSTNRAHNLLRAAHSIKGCSATLGLESIETLAHQLEDIFRVLDRPELPFDRELELLLFQIYDCLNQLIAAQIKGEKLDPNFETDTQLIRANIDLKIGQFIIEGQQTPEYHLCGVDLVRSIFEVDVAESLVRLNQIILDPALFDLVVPEFRAQSDVFTGISLLTNTPGFGQIARNTIDALDLDPDSAHEICCSALVHFYDALKVILGECGEMEKGGECGEMGECGECGECGEKDRVLVLQRLEVVDVVGFDCDLEDIFDFCAPEMLTLEIVDSFNPSFDLEDIFDLPVLHPEIDTVTSLKFDLEDIFDLPVLHPEIDTVTSLKFDLEDIFDLSQSPSLPVSQSPSPPVSHSPTPISSLIANITSNFDKFAPATLATFTPPPQAIKPSRIKKARKIVPNATPQLSVRVTLDRLERMNNLMGELAIERNGLAASSAQIVETLAQLRSKCANFQTISDRLQQIADTLSIHNHQPSLSNSEPDDDLDEQFDILELDQYTEVHHIAQATIEQLAQIEEQIEDLDLFTTQSHQQIERQKEHLSHLRNDLRWARMLPLGEILNRFPRTIHDLSVEFNKPVDLKITGAGVLVDRAVIDKLLDPLVHLLRNAFDHGIDSLAARTAMNKPECGSIEITAYHQGSQTIIEITDDGGGIDLDRIKSKAVALNVFTPLAAATATTEQLFDLLFTPGFSTADRVTKLSGRGMGLDIVKEQIRSINGTISINSKLGRGTTFTLCIPLTLTIAQLMVCQSGNAMYAFPAASIQKIVVPTPAQISSQGSQRVFHWRDLTIPIYNLTNLLPYAIPIPARAISRTLKSSADNPEDWLSPLFLIRTGSKIVALEIDRLITEQELTIKPFGKAITPPSYSYGCTILGDGVVLPVLDPHTLVEVLIDRPCCPIIPSIPTTPAINTHNSILVVDDSITTRQSLCLSLEKFGYRTLQAKDGQEALQNLRQKSNEISLVVCDVEMPNMNGFEFLNVYRQDATLTHIPVVMLTSRSNTKHRQFAAHLGAVDYFIKPYLEQEFMTAIGKLVNK